jgi:hypothetical protein
MSSEIKSIRDKIFCYVENINRGREGGPEDKEETGAA